MKLTEEKFVAFCKKVLPLPTELKTCRDCLSLDFCIQKQGPAACCPLISLGSAGLEQKGDAHETTDTPQCNTQ